MADSKREKEAAAASADLPDRSEVTQKLQAEAVTPEAAEVRGGMPIDFLIRNSYSLLGVEPFVAAGALSGVERETMTTAAATKRITDWLDQPVNKEA